MSQPIVTPHLTGTTRCQAETYAGMAHFAASGPPGKTCRECALYDVERGAEGNLLLSRCSKFESMTGKRGQRYVHHALACKYFEQADPVPPEFEAKK